MQNNGWVIGSHKQRKAFRADSMMRFSVSSIIQHCSKTLRMKYLLALAISLIFLQDGFGQNDFYNDSHVSKDEKIPYLVSLPEDYNADSNKKHPLILFLHGGDGFQH